MGPTPTREVLMGVDGILVYAALATRTGAPPNAAFCRPRALALAQWARLSGRAAAVSMFVRRQIAQTRIGQ